MLELSEGNLDWLGQAIQAEWDTEGAPWVSGRSGRQETTSWPELPSGLRYKRRGDGSPRIVGWHRCESGGWKSMSKSVGDVQHMGGATLEGHLLGLGDYLTDLLSERHVGEPPAGPKSAALAELQATSGETAPPKHAKGSIARFFWP